MAASDLSDFRARLGLDSSPVEEGFKKVEVKAGLLDKVFAKVGMKFGQSLGLDNIVNKLGGSFANKFIGLFAAGAVAAGIKNAIAGTIAAAIDEATDIGKLQRQFSKFNFSAGDIQALQNEARRTGDTIERITQDARRLKEVLDFGSKGPVIISDEEVKAFEKLVRLSEQLGSNIAKVGTKTLGGAARVTADNPALAAARVALFGPIDAGLQIVGEGIGLKLKEMIFGKDKSGGQAGGADRFLSPDQAGLIEAKIKKITDEETKRQSTINDASFKLMDERMAIEKQIAELGESNSEKRARLEREITELKQKQLQFQGSPILREQFGLAEARARLELGGIKDKLPQIEALKGDRLSSVGNFLGSDPTRSGSQVRDSLRNMERSLANIERQSKVTGLRGSPVPMEQ